MQPKRQRDNIDIITIGTDNAGREFLRKLASRTKLGFKVLREELGKGIASAAKMLPQLGPQRKEGDKECENIENIIMRY